MLHKLSSRLMGWFDKAVACRTVLCMMPTSQSRVWPTPFCSLGLSYGQNVVVDPPPAESMGNQRGPPPMPRPGAQADGYTPACGIRWKPSGWVAYVYCLDCRQMYVTPPPVASVASQEGRLTASRF